MAASTHGNPAGLGIRNTVPARDLQYPDALTRRRASRRVILRTRMADRKGKAVAHRQWLHVVAEIFSAELAADEVFRAAATCTCSGNSLARPSVSDAHGAE